jgi:hypothetical protein
VPRFFGNVGTRVKTHLVLIGLTGARFSTLINFLVYNDNEEVFSTQHEFDCWDKVCLTDISGVFRRDFLLTTNQNPFEIRGLNPMAPPAAAGGDAAPSGALLEAGWYRMDGAVAQSTNTVVTDPAFLAMQIERRNDSGVASLPFSLGTTSISYSSARMIGSNRPRGAVFSQSEDAIPRFREQFPRSNCHIISRPKHAPITKPVNRLCTKVF